MNKKILQYILGAVGALFAFRFFLPGVLMGGHLVAETDAVTPRMDSEFRFLSALAGGQAAIFFYLIKGVETKLGLVLIMICTTLTGALMRVVSALQYGMPPVDGQVAIGLEIIIPLVALVIRQRVARDYA